MKSTNPPTNPARQRLLAALARRREELRARIAEQRKALERTTPASQLPGDEVDLAFARIDAGIGRELIDRHLIEIREIEQMRMRVADGSFGLCSDCGCAIGWKRLKANPVARRCTDCQALHEKRTSIAMQALTR